MQKDVEQWKSPGRALRDTERRLVLWNLGFFSTAESLTANNIVLAVYHHITNPEARQYLLRQAFEEAIHTDTFIYCCDTLGLDPDEVYNMYMTHPVDQGQGRLRRRPDASRSSTRTSSTDGRRQHPAFLRDLVGFYVIMEGIFFYAGFAMMLSLLRQNKMVGIGEQFEFIMRDECRAPRLRLRPHQHHRAREPGRLDARTSRPSWSRCIKRAVELEQRYARDACPEGSSGSTPTQFSQYVEYIADRRLERIGLPKRLRHAKNPFPWMSQATDLAKEKNFFETRVTEYQVGAALTWE